MPTARRAALLGGGVSAYVDLNFAAGSFKVDTSRASDPSLLSGWSFTRASTAWGVGPNGYYQSFASNAPRLVYDPVTLASLGILVEEARTNLCLRSQDFATTWTQTNVTVGANVTTSPDGTANAGSLIETAATGVNHRVSQSITTSAVATTLSCYLKAGSRTWAFIRMSNSVPASCFAWVNLSTGALGTVSGTGATATVQSIGNGWYRLALTVATAVAGANTIVIAGTTGDGAQDYDGTNGLTAVYLWQAQLEAGTGASSPIPTTTASVTRAADVPIETGLTISNPHTVVVEWKPSFDNGSSNRRQAVLFNFAVSVEHSIYQRQTTDLVRAFVTTDVDSTLGTGNTVAANKAAVRFATNDVGGSLNGAAVVTDSTATLGIMDRLYVGTAGASNFANGTISRIRIYNRALSDAQLQSLTS